MARAHGGDSNFLQGGVVGVYLVSRSGRVGIDARGGGSDGAGAEPFQVITESYGGDGGDGVTG